MRGWRRPLADVSIIAIAHLAVVFVTNVRPPEVPAGIREKVDLAELVMLYPLSVIVGTVGAALAGPREPRMVAVDSPTSATILVVALILVLLNSLLWAVTAYGIWRGARALRRRRLGT